MRKTGNSGVLFGLFGFVFFALLLVYNISKCVNETFAPVKNNNAEIVKILKRTYPFNACLSVYNSDKLCEKLFITNQTGGDDDQTNHNGQWKKAQWKINTLKSSGETL